VYAAGRNSTQSPTATIALISLPPLHSHKNPFRSVSTTADSYRCVCAALLLLFAGPVPAAAAGITAHHILRHQQLAQLTVNNLYHHYPEVGYITVCVCCLGAAAFRTSACCSGWHRCSRIHNHHMPLVSTTRICCVIAAVCRTSACCSGWLHFTLSPASSATCPTHCQQPVPPLS
jgi:hypothetical protein